MILFRDVSHSGTQRLPAFLEGCQGLQRANDDGCDILTTGEPLLIPRANAVVWHAIADGWECGQHGDVEHNQLLRKRPDLPMVPVRDRYGRIWMAPKILDQAGNMTLALGWGKDANGVRIRIPTKEQAQLIAIVEAARSELKRDQFESTPLDVLVSWVYPLIEAVYYLSGDVIDALGLADDLLGVLIVTASLGFPKELGDG